MTNALKVAIDARLPDVGQGGVQQVINTLSSGFSQTQEDSVIRCWLVLKGTTWWKNSLPSGDELIEVDPPFGALSLILANRFPRLVSVLFPIVSRLIPQKPPYDRMLQNIGVDVVHLPFQDGFATEFPTIYHPHDLQHKYFVDNFSKAQIRHRETIWRAKALQAKFVMAASPYVAADLEKFWGVPKNVIQMIPIPPPERIDTNDSILAELPTSFALYPAAFWNHKNHKNLLHAISLLSKANMNIPLVLVGAQIGNFAEVTDLICKLNLENQVRILGHVSNSELTSLIKSAKVVVVPSLFEAMSLTVWDAQKLGTAVTCSEIAPFPCQVGTTALLFDPYDPISIAEALSELWTNEGRRLSLAQEALARTSGLTAGNYANAIIGVYQSAMNTQPSSSSNAAREQLVRSICEEPL